MNPYRHHHHHQRETIAPPPDDKNSRANDNKANDNNNNPHLTGILSKLRPFQREAFDFCTRGIPLPTRRNQEQEQQRQQQSQNHHHRQGCKVEVTSSVTTSDHKKHCNNNHHYRQHQQHQQHQNNGEYSGKGRILLADEMGLGKTITSLAIMTYYMDEWPLLILCPASLKYTWPSEIERFLPGLPASAIYVVSGMDDSDFHDNPTKKEKIKIVIASYSLLQRRSASAQTLQQFQFQCVIADESHVLKQRNTQRTKLAMPLLQKTKRLVLVTGTPALARPVELFTQLHCLAPTLFLSSSTGTKQVPQQVAYNDFTKRYCNAHKGRFGWDVTGLSNPEELHAKLCQIMVRRLKAHVLTELPPKQRSLVPMMIPDSNNIPATKAIKDILTQLRQTSSNSDALWNNSNNDGMVDHSHHFEARQLLMQAYQASGMAKAPAVCEYLLEWLRGSGTTQKVLVFGHHQGVLDAIEVALCKADAATSKKQRGVTSTPSYRFIRIDGRVASAERAHRVRQFQTSPDIRVALLSMTAAGVGITLTAASTVMFTELHWTPGVLAQAEDRCHRIGQVNSVHIQYLICRDADRSVDMQLWHMLSRKVGTLGKVVDGQRNASLQATVLATPQQCSSSNNDMIGGAAMSGQAEMQNFFAENGSATSKKRGLDDATPVKGSILQFFSKKAKRQTKDIEQGRQSQRGKGLNDQKDPERAATTASTITFPRENRKVEWACGSCTYHNCVVSARAQSSLTCKLCGTPCEKATAPNSVSPSPAKRPNQKQHVRQQEPIVVDLEDSPVQKRVIKSNEPSTGGRHERNEPSTGGRQVINEPIVVDLEDAHVKRRVVRSNEPSTGRRQVIDLCSATTEVPIASNSTKDSKDLRFRTVATNRRLDEVESNPKGPFLLFSVSRNSGRITPHFAESGESTRTNFDLQQVITQDTTNQLFESKLDRKGKGLQHQVHLKFNQAAIHHLVSGIQVPKKNASQAKRDIISFLQSYEGLRAVEKKTIMENGGVFSGDGLRKAVVELFTKSAPKQAATTERYSGGAKEQAGERMAQGNADEKDMAILKGTRCAWCGGYLSESSRVGGVKATYCSRECAEEGRLKRGGLFASSRVRDQVFAIEGGICRRCCIDANALYIRTCALQPAERLNYLINAGWQLPKTAKAVERLLQDPKAGDFWQADHVRAVAEGGGSCGLENLRTLCVPCHNEVTCQLHGRLKLQKALEQESDSTTRQRRIGEMFDVR